ncbi:hypothetical protein FTO74_07330 [Granulicella sp. WH15]|uniref:S4 domain-containing protein n=1 Tax=Granulicella sp. WH15 TaxID=2602070 RepID=UPI0013673A11|nr:S4 domain-containing protein [Granulicella sp. WH15]QHN03203.1 hypothetical protein FTO74_07330 [Granulicella sp. WH15]
MGMLGLLHVDRVLDSVWRWGLTYRRQREPTVLTYYGLQEKDLPGLLRDAWSLDPAHPLEGFVSLLERRLDNVAFRMGFAGSFAEARALIGRGQILVNRHPPQSGSLMLWPGDVIHFTSKPYDASGVSRHLQQRPLPSYLQYLNSCMADRGVMLSLPNLGHSPFPLSQSNSRCSRTSARRFQEESMADSRILLAHTPQGAIFACQCGAIHITAGELAFSVTLEEFVVMLELHHQAISTLEAKIVAVRELCQRRETFTNTNQTVH